jgi:hypothetical protein
VQSDRKRELSALPNEMKMLSRLMTLMHSWLIRVTLVADNVFTQNCDTGNHSAMYSVETLCSKYKEMTFSFAKRRSLKFLALLGAPYIYIYIYDISRLRVNLLSFKLILIFKTLFSNKFMLWKTVAVGICHV